MSYLVSANPTIKSHDLPTAEQRKALAWLKRQPGAQMIIGGRGTIVYSEPFDPPPVPLRVWILMLVSGVLVSRGSE